MNKIERYVFGAFFSSFFLAFLVLSFVLTIGLMVQIVGYILDGLPLPLVGEFAAVSFPETMQWTIPLALLTAGILVFSRLSADSEISAMRACGIHLLSVMKGPIVFGLLCTWLGVWVNNQVVPRGHLARRNLKAKVSVESSLDVLQPGRWIEDFPKTKIYFARKEGNWLYDVIANDYSSSKFTRMIRAKKAQVTDHGRDVIFDLYGLTVDPIDADHPGMMSVDYYRYEGKDALKSSAFFKKDGDMRLSELCQHIQDLAGEYQKAKLNPSISKKDLKKIRGVVSKAKVELSKRFVFAFASICFVLVGIPLGIRAQRKESSIGMAVALATALGYYMLVMLMLSLEKNASIHPEYLIWLPVLLSGGLGFYLVKKHL